MVKVKMSASLANTLRGVTHKNRAVDIMMRAMHVPNPPRPNSQRDYSPAKRGTKILSSRMIGDYFSMREKSGLISFMPAGKEQQLTPDGRWSLSGRQAISPVKWLRSMFSDHAIRKLKLTEKDFAAFSPEFKSAENSMLIKIRAATFHEAYNSENFIDGAESIGSCMWDSNVGPFYKHYGAKVVAAQNADGILIARAVLWDNAVTFKDSTPTPFMDRIYATQEWVVESMKDWARSNGYAHLKNQNNSNEGRLIMPDGSSQCVGLMVIGHHPDIDFYPYMDTFRWSDGSLFSWEKTGWYYKFDCTDGSYSGNEPEYEYFDVDGDGIHEDDLDDYEDVDGERYHRDDNRICWLRSEDRYELTRRCVNTDGGDWELRSECVRVGMYWYRRDSDDVCMDVDGTYILAEDSVEVDGVIYHTDDHRICLVEESGEYELVKNCVRRNGEWITKERAEEMDSEAVELAELAAGGRP